jgi:hypothetical protein
MSTVPEVEAVYYPKGRGHGSYVVVLECEDDRVKFKRHDRGQEPHEQVVRLSTFVSRFEPSNS